MAERRGTPKSFIAAITFLVVLCAFAVNPSQSGAPPKKTGAPGDGTGAPGNSGTCNDVGCHNSFSINSGSGSVEIDAPSVYEPGETVPITVTVQQEGAERFGFEITAQDTNGTKIGSWVLGSSTRRTIGNSSYLTHTVTTQSSWTFGWDSPLDPVDVTFYAAGNAADGKFDSAGDWIYTTNKLIVPNVPAGVDEETLLSSSRIAAVYPYPADRDATITIEVDAPSHTRVTLFDLNGREVVSQDRGTLSPGRHELRLNLSSVPSGLYALDIRCGEDVHTRAITVIRSH